LLADQSVCNVPLQREPAAVQYAIRRRLGRQLPPGLRLTCFQRGSQESSVEKSRDPPSYIEIRTAIVSGTGNLHLRTHDVKFVNVHNVGWAKPYSACCGPRIQNDCAVWHAMPHLEKVGHVAKLLTEIGWTEPKPGTQQVHVYMEHAHWVEERNLKGFAQDVGAHHGTHVWIRQV